MATRTVLEVLCTGLKAEGFSGLVQHGICGCLADDLSPGGCLCDGCEPGYAHHHSQRPSDWMVSSKKDGVTDADIERCIAECG